MMDQLAVRNKSTSATCGLQSGPRNSSSYVSKCEFCEVSFKTELDTSRHLSSQIHQNNVDRFLSIKNLKDQSVQKEIPKNLAQMLKILKLRHVKDLKDLVGRGFFDIIDEPIADIATKLAQTLLKSYVEFESRNLAPRIRSMLIEAISGGDANKECQTLKEQIVARATGSPQQPKKATPAKSRSQTLVTGQVSSDRPLSVSPRNQSRKLVQSASTGEEQQPSKNSEKRRLKDSVSSKRRQTDFEGQGQKSIQSKALAIDPSAPTLESSRRRPASTPVPRLVEREKVRNRGTEHQSHNYQGSSVKSQHSSSIPNEQQSAKKAASNLSKLASGPPPRPQPVPNPNSTYVPQLAKIKKEPQG